MPNYKDGIERMPMDLKTEILFWICVPFLVAFMFLIMIPFGVDHLIRRYVIKQKNITAWEWFGQSEMEMFGVDYDNEDEKMFHGNPSDYNDKDK